MNNTSRITLAALACSVLLAAPLAQAQDDSITGLFLNGAVGNASIDENNFDDDATTFQINGGYRWGVLGVEAGYVNFDEFTDEFQDLGLRGDLDGWNLGVNARTTFAESWYLSGRLGAFIWNADGDSFVIDEGGDLVPARFDDDGTDFYAGLGVGYDFNEKFGMGLAYDHFRANGDNEDFTTNVLSLTGEVRF